MGATSTTNPTTLLRPTALHESLLPLLDQAASQIDVFLAGQVPDKALEIAREIRARQSERPLNPTNLVELVRIEAMAHFNKGDTKSLVTHPATTTHQRLSPEIRAQQGITDGMVRLSVGLEDPVDLQADLAQALAAI